MSANKKDLGAERTGRDQGFLTSLDTSCSRRPELAWRWHWHPLTLVPPTCVTPPNRSGEAASRDGVHPCSVGPPDAPHLRCALKARWRERKCRKDAQDMNEPADA